MKAQDIIIKPILTEKGYDGIASKKYTFKVAKGANKTQIMGRNEGLTSSYKKAVVQLTEDSKPIEYFNSLS